MPDEPSSPLNLEGFPLTIRTPHLELPIILTAERARHIAEQHPDLWYARPERLEEVLQDPDWIQTDARDSRGNKRIVGGCRGSRERVRLDHSRESHFTATQRRNPMATRGVKIQYDSLSDVLYVHFVPPYAEQWIDNLDDETTARMNPVTKAVEGLEVWHYMARIEAGEDVTVPVEAGQVRVLAAA
jgi:uncharacterized protein YuzE